MPSTGASVAINNSSSSIISPINVTLIIYVIKKLPFLQSLPFIGPGFDLSVRDANDQFSKYLHFNHIYIAASNITTCPDFVANYDLMTRYYYTEGSSRNANDIMAFAFAGNARLHAFFQITRGTRRKLKD